MAHLRIISSLKSARLKSSVKSSGLTGVSNCVIKIPAKYQCTDGTHLPMLISRAEDLLQI